MAQIKNIIFDLGNVTAAQHCGLNAMHNPSGTCFTSWLPEYLAKFK